MQYLKGKVLASDAGKFIFILVNLISLTLLVKDGGFKSLLE
jgi:hypothetical protein